MKPILGRGEIWSLLICHRRATGVECHSRTTGAAWGKHRSAGTGWNYMRVTLFLYPPFVSNLVNNAPGIEFISTSTGYVCHSREKRVKCHRQATGVEYQGGATRATRSKFRSAGTGWNSKWWINYFIHQLVDMMLMMQLTYQQVVCATPEQQGSSATMKQLESRATSEQQGRQVANSDQQVQVVTLYILLHPPIVVYVANNASDIEVISISTGCVFHSKATRFKCHSRAAGVECCCDCKWAGTDWHSTVDPRLQLYLYIPFPTKMLYIRSIYLYLL